ncbi:hypothetical protein CGMCC3_g17865 [Colletotrichum fructicola]|uniref:BZIP domain-containing protein n=1 Tax=Colletotrichum fructicola (strain Nara gc5) TaxID=1213859 RepID=A0A7J6IS57_COLFN|nr:uncharacterized protein CGMCC3_g17865 [Colletotrichum fructicola]KAE9565962.1 hypothetical protein CGMCC3_g17865 [Colletotrichum fructicola]KAF4422495.1 AP-1-like transcription factor napA [Colletotrichum fructicola]KAF4478702.1 hypothetical protein CGGC5_v013022 [Colletotrichum fructicola Nara gc5]KAF4881402.1 hypothetical protein CGCFRS4_v015600 [Colletotrichum fructicola]
MAAAMDSIGSPLSDTTEHALLPSTTHPATTRGKGRPRSKKSDSDTAKARKRREQNRVNQRAHRQRRDRKLQDLEHQVDELVRRNEAIQHAYQLLSAKCHHLCVSLWLERSVMGVRPASIGWGSQQADGVSVLSSWC